MSEAEIRHREMKHIEEAIKDDRIYTSKLNRLYDDALDDIQRAIAADIDGFAYRDGVSVTEAKKIIKQTDVRSYEKTAKRIVEEAAKRRDKGEVVTYGDYTSKVNRELRHYNVTMRTNRLELLQARVNAVTVDLASREELMLGEKLYSTLVEETTRQSGILKMTVPSEKQLERRFKAAILSDVTDTRGADFADSIWANQAELRDEINNIIRRTLIRGEHPTIAARRLRGLVRDTTVSASKAANNIAITEVARAQTISQKLSFDDGGYTHYLYIAETDNKTCPTCEALDDGKPKLVSKMRPWENAPPMHHRCRCSVAATVKE